MMTAEELIVEVRNHGAVPPLIDAKLKVAPPGKLPSDLKDQVRQRAYEIKALLAGQPDDRLSPERNRWPDVDQPAIPLRRCGALVCPTCHVHNPSYGFGNGIKARTGLGSKGSIW